MRFLHSRHGDLRKGAAGCESRTRAVWRSPTPSATTICRCTGYKKIIDAIELAAKMLREDTRLDDAGEDGQGRLSGSTAWTCEGKVLGTGQYVDDMDQVDLPGMIYGSAVRAKYPRALVTGYPTRRRRKALPGVVCGADRRGRAGQE